MEWIDCEFVCDGPIERRHAPPDGSLTGWETVVFEIRDETDEEVATFCPRPAAQRP